MAIKKTLFLFKFSNHQDSLISLFRLTKQPTYANLAISKSKIMKKWSKLSQKGIYHLSVEIFNDQTQGQRGRTWVYHQRQVRALTTQIKACPNGNRAKSNSSILDYTRTSLLEVNLTLFDLPHFNFSRFHFVQKFRIRKDQHNFVKRCAILRRMDWWQKARLRCLELNI